MCQMTQFVPPPILTALPDLKAARGLMAEHGWLSRVPESFREAMLGRCVLQTFAQGATIYASGDPPGGMYGVVSGSVSVDITQGARGPYFAHFMLPGDWFGEGPVISGGPRIAGFTATRDSVFLYAPLSAIQDILRDQPESWRIIATLVVRKLEIALWAVDDLMIPDGFKRLIAVLLRVGGCRGATPPTVVFPAHVSQQNLAAMANVSRRTAIRILRKLEEAGHIEQSYRHIRILEPSALRRMLEDQ